MNAREILEKFGKHIMGADDLPYDEFEGCEAIPEALSALQALLIEEIEKLRKDFGEVDIYAKQTYLDIKTCNQTLSDAIECIKRTLK